MSRYSDMMIEMQQIEWEENLREQLGDSKFEEYQELLNARDEYEANTPKWYTRADDVKSFEDANGLTNEGDDE